MSELKSASSFLPQGKITRSKKSWKRVTMAEKLFFEGNTGKALVIFFKYESCEARAMLFLAYMYFEGYGVIQNMDKGVRYLQNLAYLTDYRKGEKYLVALALFYLGELYYKGCVLPRDDSLAERHWLRGAKMGRCQGAMQCQSSLGMFYSHPDHLDPKKAFTWHRKAEKSGSLLSSGALGVMYLYGIGTHENRKLAYQHLKKSANHGNTYAKGHLAAYYYKMKMFSRATTVAKELAEGDEDLVDQGVEHARTGVTLGCYYLALCTGGPNTKALIEKAITLSPSIAYDIHARAILGRI